MSLGTTVGVVGTPLRATVGPGGAVEPDAATPRLDWWVASEERWHDPTTEPGVRQQAMGGMPVVETRLRVPGGDVVHRVYGVADEGGLIVVEVANESGRTVAVAFSHRRLRTARPPSDTPIEGLAAPDGAWVHPLAHGAVLRVALGPADPAGWLPLPTDLPSADAAVRGWQRQVEGRERYVLAGASPSVDVAGERARLLLDGLADHRHDPVGHLVGAWEMVVLGHDAAGLVPGVARAATDLAVAHRGAASLPWEADAALEAAALVLSVAGERDAVADVAVTRARLPAVEANPAEPPEGVVGVAWLRRRMVRDAAGVVDLLPAPFPEGWLGRNVEAHGLHAGGGEVSFAVRWHGARPALLWEGKGVAAFTCTGLDPSWHAAEPQGEALLAAP